MNKLYLLSIYFIGFIFLFSSCRKAEQELTGIVRLPGARTGSGVMDIDGNKYPTIILSNGQEWMRQNLRVKRISMASQFQTYRMVRNGLN